jgi:hypothetical protein
MHRLICYLLATSLILIPYAGFGNASDSSARLVPRDGSTNYEVPLVDESRSPADQLTIIGIVSLLVTGFLAGFLTRGMVNSRKVHSEDEKNIENAKYTEKAQSSLSEMQDADDHADDNLKKFAGLRKMLNNLKWDRETIRTTIMVVISSPNSLASRKVPILRQNC